MRPDVWILILICASVCAEPAPDNDVLYTIEVIRNGTTLQYKKKTVQITYNESETVYINFIRSRGLDGKEPAPFMKLYWIKENRRVEKDDIKQTFIRSIRLPLTPNDDDSILQCEIYVLGIHAQTLEVHFFKWLSSSEESMRNNGNLFKIILICLGAFIAISILVMILIALYKYLKSKLTSRHNTTMYPDFAESTPMNKINNKPKNTDDDKEQESEKGVVNISRETIAIQDQNIIASSEAR